MANAIEKLFKMMISLYLRRESKSMAKNDVNKTQLGLV